MVWNEDLAKLKQQLKEQGSEAPPPAPPKPAAPSQPTRSLLEEDDVFLSAMGHARPAQASTPLPPASGPSTVASAQLPGSVEDFQDAMAQLGGVKGLSGDPRAQLTKGAPPLPEGEPAPPSQAAPVPSPGMLARPDHLPPGAEPEAETVDIPSPPPQGIRPRPGPLLIQLAAGMAIEVDASLDLRGHSVSDAKERLRERIADGLAMGWRTLHVNLGPSEALKQGLLAFLASSAASAVQRYAQAPVPMGGAQAWILYLGVPGA